MDSKKTGDKVTAGKLRLQSDLTEYNEDKIKGIDIQFPNPNNIMEMLILVDPPKETFYAGGIYEFRLNFPVTYPIDAPTLELKQKIFHPNIDYNGKVCLPLLRDDWKPTHTLYNIICGLIFLFNSPNPKDPLNVDAGVLMNDNLEEFKKTLAITLKGGNFKNEKFDKMIK